jgi:hypothetical protein
MRTFLLIVMLLAISSLASAQDEFWHFAYDQTQGQIIAFTINGETRTHFVGTPANITGYRIDERSALVFIQTDDSLQAALITPDQLTVLDYAFSEPQTPVAFRYPYVVFIPISVNADSDEAVVIDLQNDEAVPLGTVAPKVDVDSCCVLHPDGITLAYIAWLPGEAGDSARYQLRNRNLLDDAEIVIYEFRANEANRLGQFDSNGDGTVWLESAFIERDDTTTVQYSAIQQDGQALLLDEFPLADLVGASLPRWFNDTVFAAPVSCPETCTAQLTTPTGEMLTWQLSPDYADYTTLIHYTTDFAVIQSGQYMLRLNPSTPPQLLGLVDPRRITPPYLSPDHTYALLTGGETGDADYSLVNLFTGEHVYIAPDEPEADTTLTGAVFAETVVLLIDWGTPDRVVIVDRQTEAARQVALREGATPFEALSANELLIFQRRNAEEQGIYHFAVDDQEWTPLITGNITPIYLQTLEAAVSFPR